MARGEGGHPIFGGILFSAGNKERGRGREGLPVVKERMFTNFLLKAISREDRKNLGH